MANASDFRPYLSEISDCHCERHCRPRMYIQSLNSGQLVRYDQGAAEALEAIGENLLAALKAGTHEYLSMADFIAEAKRVAIENGTYGQRGGVKVRIEM